MINQQHSTRVFKCFCDYVFRWHSDIFQHTEETSETCAESVEKTWWTDLVHQQEEELIWDTGSMLLEICHMTEWDHSKFTEDKSSHRLTEIHKTEENADFLESNKLLLMICHTALLCGRISDLPYMQEWRISLKCRTEKDLCES